MSQEYTIAEDFTLPSEGKIYSKNVNPNFKIRSMTVEEEMKRLGHSDLPYKNMCEILDDCMIQSPGISTYDMCIGDYQFVLHKARIVTYGTEYETTSVCPVCGAVEKDVFNLDDLTVKTYTEDVLKDLSFELPRTKKLCTITFMTPRILDNIVARQKEAKKKNPSVKDLSMIYTLEALIKTIDGEELLPFNKETFVRKLNMMDANAILQHSDKFNEGIGLDTTVFYTCGQCGSGYPSTFRITSEFFRPTIY